MSSGKVTCQNCGWSWNKSDSSKKDMYICHECGRDNSNNMKNGGWLDNYGEEANANEGHSSASKEWVGDGYSNVGRNYSPAWGGQFQMGGNIYPVNYVPQAQGGMSLPGAGGHMYARVGAPSKGPRRNQTDVTDASAQNGKEMQYYQNGLDFKPKSISKNGGWLDSYEEGGVIKDDMGYWNPDNWDSPVEIGSNEITMKHVPFDVLGISDEGDIKHMKPGKNYKYKGKKVTEFRMAKNGIRQEQKGLVNLDQLTNFTNYNTKQPGGWLDNL